MYPSVLLIHADMGKIIVNTRERTIAAAAENARRLGLHGLKYSWESAFTGTHDDYFLKMNCVVLELHSNIIMLASNDH